MNVDFLVSVRYDYTLSLNSTYSRLRVRDGDINERNIRTYGLVYLRKTCVKKYKYFMETCYFRPLRPL